MTRLGMTLLGIDLGSSSVKASLVDAESGRVLGSAASPEVEMAIEAPRPGWAEQDPEAWWTHAQRAVRGALAAAGVPGRSVRAVGIAYQMHGLVLTGEGDAPLRPAVIWCDGRAADTGRRAFDALGRVWCLEHLLGSPGNFTASKLAWVQQHEPGVVREARHALLPGDWLAYRLTGEPCTTDSGLSEAALWDFTEARLAAPVLRHYGLDERLVPARVPTFGHQGALSESAAAALGLDAGTPLTYRAGDQPNNALALGALAPGEVAATAGTSGVLYGVAEAPRADPRSRVNTFLHATHTAAAPRYGVLLCLNGVGSLYRWLRETLSGGHAPLPYPDLNALALGIPPGADGLTVLPFGNGAERVLEDHDVGAAIVGLDVNRHTPGHLVRAVQEGIAFGFRYGAAAMRETGVAVDRVRAPRANLFLSDGFAQTVATAIRATVELVDTDGSVGAARGAGIGAGVYAAPADAFATLTVAARVAPDASSAPALDAAYARWTETLAARLALL